MIELLNIIFRNDCLTIMPNSSANFSEPSTSISLLDRANQGDSLAWKNLVQVYGAIVYAWARRSGCQRADAADVVQDVFVSLSKGLAKFDATSEGSTFRGWLWTITRNKIADIRRRQSSQPSAKGGSSAQAMLANMATSESSLHEPESDPPTSAHEDQQQILARTLALIRVRFDPISWQAFWRTAVEHQDAASVALELNISRWAVYKAKSRVLHALRTEFSGIVQFD
jgi:RNA polymerase sigma-70 factor, ECF subfamily